VKLDHRMGISMLCAIAGIALTMAAPAAAQQRLQRPAENEGMTFGQETLSVVIPLHRERRPDEWIYQYAVCKPVGPVAAMIYEFARTAIDKRVGRKRVAFASLDQTTRIWVATEVAAALDGVDAEAIRRDEAIGPGAYRPAIDALIWYLGLCPELLARR
jgi:hypothetical protein